MSSILFQYNSSEDLIIYQQSKIRCKTSLHHLLVNSILLFPGWFPCLMNIFFNLFIQIMEEVHCMEQFFIKLQTIYAFVCQVNFVGININLNSIIICMFILSCFQICFFIICDAFFCNDYSTLINNKDQSVNTDDKSIIIGLTTILFYNVFGYFISRLRDIWIRNRISFFHAVPSVGSYIKWMCKIFLEWIKAVVVILCLREQGITYHPKLSYSLLTFSYYLFTEKIFLEVIPTSVEAMNLDCLENLEHLYIPMMLNIYAILAAVTVGSYNLIENFTMFTAFSLYFIIYLRIKDLYFNQWQPLVAERKAYKSFKVATRQDIQNWADICAVCLSSMSRARITPCNHLFHPRCLKQCLRASFYCPLCKQHFMENRSETK